MFSPQIFLFHYAPFQPLWEQKGMVQCGPNISTDSRGIEVKRPYVQDLKDALDARGYSTNGVLVHYTDPFIIKSSVLKGLRNWIGPKLLVCGDLHHGHSPIETLIEYQVQEFHDAVLLAFNPIFLNLLRSRLNVPVSCYPPGFFRYPSREKNQYPKKCLLHVGSIGPYHKTRRNIVEKLLSRKRIPFVHTSTKDAESAADFYNSYALVLNIPLNNDLNHRFFEVMAAGSAQVIFGSKELLGGLQNFGEIPGTYWANTILKLENLVIELFQNPNTIKPPESSIDYLSIRDLIKIAFLNEQCRLK